MKDDDFTWMDLVGAIAAVAIAFLLSSIFPLGFAALEQVP